MRVLLISVGNHLRRDDGVAHAVTQLPGAADFESRALIQLTPEVAEDIAGYDAVIFLDADARAADSNIETLDESRSVSALTHVSSPAEIVELSRTLFGFAGQAFLCRIPVDDLSFGEGLSFRAREHAARAARELAILLRDLRSAHRI